jgi:hypothetical protein
VTSASSKAAIGLAHLLSQADQALRRQVIGITSAANLGFVSGLGLSIKSMHMANTMSLPAAAPQSRIFLEIPA